MIKIKKKMKLTEEELLKIACLFFELVDSTYGCDYSRIGEGDGLYEETAEDIRQFALKYSQTYFKDEHIEIKD